MIDLRWLEYENPAHCGEIMRKLQYRVLLPADWEWTEWADVPTVKEQEK